MYKKRQSKKTRNIKKKINRKTKKTNIRKNKFSRRTKYRTRKNRGGMAGIATKGKPSDATNFFIDHSNISYLSKGSNGFTFVATLNPSDISNSPYTSTDAETYGQPVNKILFKLVFLRNRREQSEDIYFSDQSQHNLKLLLAREQSFNEEVEIQKEVYTKTMDYLEPICPAIVFSQIYKDDRGKLDILQKIKNRTSADGRTRQILNSIINQGKRFSIGLIVMEFADGYMTMYDIDHLPNNNPKKITQGRVECIFRYLLLELALKTGYHHADFHNGNLFIKPDNNNANPNYNYFYKPTITTSKLGKPLLIDFGLTVKIQEDYLQRIKNECTKKNYLKALQILCRIPRKDGERIDYYDWRENYGWACNIEHYGKEDYISINRYIDALFTTRNIGKEALKDEFNKTHPHGPTLPLKDESSKIAVKENNFIEPEKEKEVTSAATNGIAFDEPLKHEEPEKEPEKEEEQVKINPDNFWNSTVDPKTGNTYYYNTITGRVTWDRPAVMDAHKEEEKPRETNQKKQNNSNLFVSPEKSESSRLNMEDIHDDDYEQIPNLVDIPTRQKELKRGKPKYEQNDDESNSSDYGEITSSY
jgi:hypothetical protein